MKRNNLCRMSFFVLSLLFVSLSCERPVFADALGDVKSEATREIEKEVSGERSYALERPHNGDYYATVKVVEGFSVQSVKELKPPAKEPKGKLYEVEVSFKVSGFWSVEPGKEKFTAEKRTETVKLVYGKDGKFSAWMKKLSYPYLKEAAVGKWVMSKDPHAKEASE